MTYPCRTCLGTYPQPVNKTFSRHDVIGNLLLLFITMTNARCGLKHCSVTKNSNDIYPKTYLERAPPPPSLEHVRARTPFSYHASLVMYPPYYLSNKMLLYIAINHAWNLIVKFLKFLRRPECNLKPESEPKVSLLIQTLPQFLKMKSKTLLNHLHYGDQMNNFIELSNIAVKNFS